jgi:hypothetical protein
MRGLLVLAFALLLVPSAIAGTPDAPELQDPAGDVVVDDRGLPAPNAPLPEAVADALDLRAVWFSDDADGLHAHIQVTSLAALEVGQAGNPDFMWIAIFSPAYAVESGPAARQGTWELRAEYRPADVALGNAAWHFWMERPCKDGRDDDGCSGADRDIQNGLRGEVDEASSTITITAPWPLMAEPQAGDGIEGLWGATGVDWPAYPVRSVDWDLDEGSQCYVFTALPLAAEPPSGQDGPAGSSNGRAAFPQPYQPEGCAPPPSGNTGTPAPGAGAAAAGDDGPGATTAAANGGERESPGAFAPAAVALALGLVALRRRLA